MSALRMIAWGVVKLSDMTPDQRVVLKRDARNEAHARGYWISGCSKKDCCAVDFEAHVWTSDRLLDNHKLTRWNKKTFRNPRRPGITDRNRPIAEGSFGLCCKALLNIIEPITPSNPTE